MTMSPRFASVLMLLVLTGCTSQRQTLLERTSSHVVYDMPARQVMKAAEAVLGERGYALLPSTDPLFLITPWKVSGNYDVFTHWSRIYVEGHKRPDGRFTVRAYQMAANMPARTQSMPVPENTAAVAPEEKQNIMPTVLLSAEPVLVRSARPDLRRDLELEWAIMERLDPDFAGRVKTQVDIYLAHSSPKRPGDVLE
ncbi:hypothetical protein [Corallococcus macrosporus]|uniref:Lipoprotein n=1 Tax=Myxococcus fulvus (strain ATCC BAA-855 / HW-1) TaxID=483219 RepID=F8CB44_MYXFH|nr:hypothetical protein [Corallococcus macrosporus]AEI62149.1 hypothetical protein LILAB_01085 [Corallococcus macrosporus]